MRLSDRIGHTGVALMLGLVIALAALVSSNTLVHASSHPDLSVQSHAQWHPTLVPGGLFTLKTVVENEGDGESPSTTLRYYQSTDFTITTSDTEVGTAAVEAITSGNSVDLAIVLTAPSPHGTYYYGSCVDSVANETDTTDNCTGAVLLPVLEDDRPNLRVHDAKPSVSHPAAGETFTLSTRVHNLGTGESEATTLRYYRSTDSTITTSDTEVGTDAVAAIAVNGSSLESIDLTAPSVDGTYYYGGCVDAVTDESNTEDNCQISSAQVTVDGISPTITSVSFTSDPGDDDTYGTGDTIEVTVTFTEDVTVTGNPKLEIDVGGSAKEASYSTVDGKDVVFSYTVVAGDSDTDGISIAANKLDLNGGEIEDAGGNDAGLDHTAVSADSNHLVNGAGGL